ncbi:Fur family transcriptional regulator [Parathalassolituus penaei]|uniref:Fur family transcriptional regulator n=1 Tax=Parathalassolituus penaei TaxID=2997323 RepID=A0A9X3ISJ1_9GAMM|nr:Fur family transcriptional regulator [Parathalassolituus penaei]MCY0964944.1 Fur family transcriptional regulator [Parathalassolituus penaei]
MSQNVYEPHNHSACVRHAIQEAQALCEEKGARLTRVRLRVLELIWQSHKPVGAYELLPLLAQEGFNSAPPTVYRALDFLLELGLIHRLSTINAYVGCNRPHGSHPVCFFICNCCGRAQELENDKLRAMTRQVEALLGVTVEQQMTELSGVCPACREHTTPETSGEHCCHDH